MELNKTTIFIFYEQMKNETEQFFGDNWGQKHCGRMRKDAEIFASEQFAR
jgi:hypothetical protein